MAFWTCLRPPQLIPVAWRLVIAVDFAAIVGRPFEVRIAVVVWCAFRSVSSSAMSTPFASERRIISGPCRAWNWYCIWKNPIARRSAASGSETTQWLVQSGRAEHWRCHTHSLRLVSHAGSVGRPHPKPGLIPGFLSGTGSTGRVQ